MARTSASPDPAATRLIEPPRVGSSLAPGKAASWGTGLALLFLVSALLALALLPAYLNRDVAGINQQIQGVVEPAQRLVSRVEFAQAKQLAATQGFLLSGEGRFRQRYSDAREEEKGALQELWPLTELMSLRVRAGYAMFFPLSLQWYVGHQTIFSREIVPTDSLESFPGQDHFEWLDTEQGLYEEVLSASQTLRAALASELPAAQGLGQDSLEAAQEHLTTVDLAQVQQMSALQSFLLTGEPRFRERYLEGTREEDVAMDYLLPICEARSAPVRAQAARFESLSFSWHLGHEEKVNLELVPDSPPQARQEEGFPQRVAKEQEAYEAILLASSALKEALQAEMEVGEAEMERVRGIQAQLTQALVLVGLLATGVVLLLGWNLLRLMRESETRRQEALRARREADAILGATGDGVVGMDRKGRCIFLNRAGAELLGYPTRLVVGRDVHDLLHHSHPDGRPFSRDECPIIQTLAAGGSISGMNEVLWRAGKKPFPVQISLRAVKDGPVLKGAVLTFTDMTETRAAEESLRQAVQARDEVLAVVSHDLRNPVGTIFSAASLLLEIEVPPEKRREHLQGVKRSAERMNRLIQDLLDVARMEGGVLPAIPSRFSVEALLQEVSQAHRGEAEDREVRIRTRIGETAQEGWGDRHRLIQVLSNLVENALRFSPSGAEVTIQAENDPDKPGLLFAVADQGPGISAEDQERLFDRFWQVSRKDKRGAGLGLAIAKGIVAAHGGSIWVESSEGEGSTFWFFLPGEPESAG
jgi:PAS domain S-box-containing protein